MSALDNARAATKLLGRLNAPNPRNRPSQFDFVLMIQTLRADIEALTAPSTSGSIAEYERVTAPPTDDEREALIAAVDSILNPFDATTSAQEALVLDAAQKWVNRRRGPITDEMVAAALDARASMSKSHHYLYATEKCRCGEPWTDAHWMRYVLEAAEAVR